MGAVDHLIASIAIDMGTSRHLAPISPPPFCYTCKKDGHRAMACLAKMGLNMRICACGIPGQAFYSIQVPEEDKEEKTCPGLLTIKEGVVNEGVIDAELKHLFKGKSRWTIKKIDEDNFILLFPSANLRDELTKFKGLEFATAIIKSKSDGNRGGKGGCECFRGDLG
jgi:hypothetical protein